MKKNKLKKWNTGEGSITKEILPNGLVVYRGFYFKDGINFKFSIRQQLNGPSLMRGTISPLSPHDNHIMKKSDREKTEILKNLEAKKPGYIESMQNKSIPELNISPSITCNSLEESDIILTVEKAASKIYKKYSRHIYRQLGNASSPDNILPIIAAHKYSEGFLKQNHAKCNDNTLKTYYDIIISICDAMPRKPMYDFSVKDAEAFLKKHKVSSHKEKLIREFWDYCIQTNICSGYNPFSETQIKQASVNNDKSNNAIPSILSLDNQEKLYNALIKNSNGPNSGVALVVYGGYSFKITCKFLWCDVIWGDEYDYVRIKYFKDNQAGYTHNYTAPIFISGARILRKRYEELCNIYPKEMVDTFPIASKIQDPKTACKSSALTQHALMLLKSIGFSKDDFEAIKVSDPNRAISATILLNTYKHNVTMRCGLRDEFGTANFLQHYSLSKSVSDDNYICYSDEEAGRRLFAQISVLRPKEDIESNLNSVLLSNGRGQYIISPKSTVHRVGFSAYFKLNPDEEITIVAPHGVTGSAEARSYNENGSLRRKSNIKKGTDS